VHPPDEQRRPASVITWAIGPVIERADISVLCADLTALVRDSRASVIICDVGRIMAPDAVTVEALARLQLTARRLGRDIRICRASRRLRDLVAFVGLSDVLPLSALSALAAQSAEAGGQAKQREQAIGVEKRVEPLDPAG
jgi:hypothetical protein